ncbi:MAG: radical SAM protein [Anaerolineae bacterium]
MLPSFLEQTDNRTAVSKAILRTAAYADIFDHPLAADEFSRYMVGMSAEPEEVALTLKEMRSSGQLSGTNQQDWYPLPGRESLILTRLEREQRAAALWPEAEKYGRMLSKLPFVRMVAVTGSLAVNNPDQKADIDFFIITEPDRLWLTRLLVISIVRLAARNGIELCPNYFITSDNLEIQSQNLYTAREISQMVPLKGLDMYQQFRKANRWTLNHLPNATGMPAKAGPFEPQKPSQILEYLLAGEMGNRIEKWEMGRKIRKLSAGQTNGETRFTADQCKGHVDGHQAKIMEKLKSKEGRVEAQVSESEPVSQVDLLFGQSYYLRFDPKLYAAMQPYPPLGTMIAAGLMREQGYSVDLFDAMLAGSTASWGEKVRQVRPKIAVIYEDNFNYLSKMCLLNMRDAALEMIRMAKEVNATVIICGSDATDHPGLYLKAGADFVIQGEGEETLTELVELCFKADNAVATEPEGMPGAAYLKNGRVVENIRRPVMKNIDRLPFPTWDLIDVEKYRQIWLENHGYFSMNMVTTRGCPYHCNWCAKPIWGQRYNARSAASVASEMAWLKETYQPDHIWFVDDIMGLKPGWWQEFAAEVEQLNARLPFKCLSRADLIVSRPDNVAALKQAGCDIVWLGAESGSQHILNGMEKGTKVDEIYQAADQLHAGGVKVAFFLQFGYPGESRADIEKTLQMVRDCQPDDIGMSVSYPLPGTRFHENVKLQLGDQHNWTDSADLAMMYKGPFVTEFYRHLHVVLHKEFRTRKAWQMLKRDALRPASWRPKHLREAAASIYRIATLPLARLKLNRLAAIPHEAIETLPHMPLAEAALPTKQE